MKKLSNLMCFLIINLFICNILLADVNQNTLKLAGKGDAKAQYEIGLMYFRGDVVSRDIKESFNWFYKAAEKDHPHAQAVIALMYFNAVGTEESNKDAFKWFQKSANNKDATAQYYLGRMYYSGEGVVKDYIKSFKWFKKAAKNRRKGTYQKGKLHPLNAHIESLHWLGYLYFEGKGVKQNFKKSAYWYEKAARKGHVHSQYFTGFLNEEGIGIYKNLDNARFWYEQAHSNGFKDAQEALGRLDRLARKSKYYDYDKE